MIELHLRKLRARDDISAEEEAAIRDAVSCTRSYRPDELVVPARQQTSGCTLLLAGIMARYKDLRSGERQITELHVPGDFADLHSFTLKKLDHHVTALTACTVAVVPHEKVQAITERFPHLARVYWFQTNLDAAIHREWEVSLGRRTALQRLGHLFCELQARLALVGLADATGFDFGLTQSEIAECMGLTSVHVNRTLKELRERELVEVRNGRVSIQDLQGLQRAAEFDPAYLYLEKRGG